jgi:hypothetical protein
MIALGAEHPPLQVSKGHVVGGPADVQFGVVITVRIAANDKHMFSAVTSHIGQRHGNGLPWSKGSGLSRASPIKARAGRIGKSSNGIGREQGSAAADRGC